MSLEALTRVWRYSKAEHSDLLVMLAIADYMNEYGAAWPAIDTIARKSRLSRRTVFDRITVLQAMGELTIERADVGAGRGHSNVYRLGTAYRGWSEDVTPTPGGKLKDSENSANPAQSPEIVQKPVDDLHPIRKESESSLASQVEERTPEGSGANPARKDALIEIVPPALVAAFVEGLAYDETLPPVVPRHIVYNFLGLRPLLVRVRSGGIELLTKNDGCADRLQEYREAMSQVAEAKGLGKLVRIRRG
jgi:hypothetical protein